MRNTRDRIRHALSFELLGLVLVTALGTVADFDPWHFGPLAALFSILATLWNYYYNRLFDRWLLSRLGHCAKRQRDRIVHAVLFEGGLLLVTLPVIASWMHVGLLEALVTDLAMVVFYLLYAYLFNLAYDRIYPVVGWTQ